MQKPTETAAMGVLVNNCKLPPFTSQWDKDNKGGKNSQKCISCGFIGRGWRTESK